MRRIEMCRTARVSRIAIALAATCLISTPLAGQTPKTAPEAGSAKSPATKSAEKKPDPDPAPAVATPKRIEAHFTDGSTLQVRLLDKQIQLKTLYGDLQIPTGDIQQIEFASRIPTDVAKTVEAAITGLRS